VKNVKEMEEKKLYKSKRDRFVTGIMLTAAIVVIAAFIVPYSIGLALGEMVSTGETIMVLILLTRDDFANRDRFKNAYDTIMELLERVFY